MKIYDSPLFDRQVAESHPYYGVGHALRARLAGSAIYVREVSRLEVIGMQEYLEKSWRMAVEVEETSIPDTWMLTRVGPVRG